MATTADEELLVTTDGVSELLPSNTQIFSSAVSYGLLWHLFVWLGGAATACAALAAFALKHNVAMYGAAGGVAAVTLLGAWLLARRAQAAYATATRLGEHHEGVLVFPTGDIVIAFRGCLPPLGVDTTIEAAYLSRAVVARRCSLRHLRPVRFLDLHYLRIDARPARISIAQTDLRDDVARVADYINAQKGAQFGGGGGAGGNALSVANFGVFGAAGGSHAFYSDGVL